MHSGDQIDFSVERKKSDIQVEGTTTSDNYSSYVAHIN